VSSRKNKDLERILEKQRDILTRAVDSIADHRRWKEDQSSYQGAYPQYERYRLEAKIAKLEENLYIKEQFQSLQKQINGLADSISAVKERAAPSIPPRYMQSDETATRSENKLRPRPRRDEWQNPFIRSALMMNGPGNDYSIPIQEL
jgi:chromosome segregation ATPase